MKIYPLSMKIKELYNLSNKAMEKYQLGKYVYRIAEGSILTR